MMSRMGVSDGSSVAPANLALSFIKCKVTVCVVELGPRGGAPSIANSGVDGKCV